MKIEPFSVGAFEVNCFVVTGSDRQALVIDPGAEADRIAAFIERNGWTVSAYLLTHGHVDHVSGLAELYARAPAPVALHAKDLAWAFDAANQMPPFYGVPERPAEIARVLEDGMELDAAGLRCRVIDTPGHTPGSVCFHFAADGILFSGDTLFAGSVGRTDLPGGDSRTLAASLAKLAALPDDTRVYPGHGPTTTLGCEKQTNFFMQPHALR